MPRIKTTISEAVLAALRAAAKHKGVSVSFLAGMLISAGLDNVNTSDPHVNTTSIHMGHMSVQRKDMWVTCTDNVNTSDPLVNTQKVADKADNGAAGPHGPTPGLIYNNILSTSGSGSGDLEKPRERERDKKLWVQRQYTENGPKPEPETRKLSLSLSRFGIASLGGKGESDRNPEASIATLELISEMNALSGRNYRPDAWVMEVAALLAKGYTRADLLTVVNFLAEECRESGNWKWFKPDTILRPRNFKRNLENALAQTATPTNERSNYYE